MDILTLQEYFWHLNNSQRFTAAETAVYFWWTNHFASHDWPAVLPCSIKLLSTTLGLREDATYRATTTLQNRGLLRYTPGTKVLTATWSLCPPPSDYLPLWMAGNVSQRTDRPLVLSTAVLAIATPSLIPKAVLADVVAAFRTGGCVVVRDEELACRYQVGARSIGDALKWLVDHGWLTRHLDPTARHKRELIPTEKALAL